ncbi:hypothetical protein [Lentzea flava]|uniref:Uncharacterized protein n=1 Tax=Lentzea flava TaxID=103732 RepID=A0ABQ2UR40_9PSEU|nr:hypothetical protein [Lentzea flava]MCP2201226.1 hypothetical protein [Lentzea flava]GGU49740.1 hypothetical protein GCM10010178_48200 [Lentzea flava]
MSQLAHPVSINYVEVAGKNVFIVTYGCHPDSDSEPVLSHEHKEVGLFAEDDVPGLTMPEGYKRSIATWFERLRTDPEMQKDPGQEA